MADLQSPFKQQTSLDSPFKKTDDTGNISSPFTKEGPAHKQGVFETFGSHALANSPAAGTALIGGEVGAELGTMVLPGFGTVIGGVLGAAGGGIAGSMAVRALLPDSVNKYLDEGSKQNAVPAFTGDIASFGSVAKLGVPASKKAAATLMAAGAGLEGGRQAVSGENIDPVKIGISAITTPMFGGEKTWLGRKVTGADFVMPKNTEKPEDLVGDLTKKTEWQLPKEINGIPVREGETGREHDDLTPVRAHYDPEKKEIVIDKEAVNKLYNENPNTDKGKVQDLFKSPEDFLQFVLAHEEQHTLQSFEQFKEAHANNLPPKETDINLTYAELKTEYERQMNLRAWGKLESEGYQKGRVDLNTPKDWTNADQYRDNLGLLDQMKTADGITLNSLKEKGVEAGITPELNNEFRQIEEGQGGDESNPLYQKFIKPISDAHKSVLKYLMDKGVISKEDMNEMAAPRMLEPMTDEQVKALKGVEGDQSFLEKVKSAIDEMTTDQGGMNQDINRVRGAGKQRTIYALERKNGTRTVVQFTKGEEIIEWTKGRARGLGPKEGTLKAGDETSFGTLRQASIEEIEKHSPYRYSKDYQSVLYKKYQEAREMARAHEAMENMTKSPDFEKIAHKISSGAEMPEGMARPKYLDRLPALEGYAFDTRIAQIIEDFARVRTPNMLTRVSGLLIQNMMLNPLPHMFNEVMHLYNARGLTGWVTPAGIKRFAEHAVPAIRSVITQDENYRDIIKAGGHMLAPGTRNNPIEDSLYKKGIDEFAKTSDFKELAKSFGKTTKDLYVGLSKASSKAMWISRDIMYTQYVNELKATKGLDTAAAVKEAERHMPNYKLPERVGQGVLGEKMSRGLSEVLNNPNVSVFSRYHYGMVKSMIETAKDVGAIRQGKAGLEQFKEGLDTIAAISVALSVLYPLMDMLAQELTGNPEAKQRRAGPYHLMNAISEVSNGTKEPQAVLAAVFTFNPAILALGQLAVDKQMYNGQPIYHPTDDPSIIASDVGNYLAKQVPSVSSSLRVSDETGGGLPQLAAQQIDIQSPSTKQTARIDKIRHRDIRASEIREQKRKLREYFNR